ncbi:sulfite exporter TauE/SafE family protein [Actinokineospora xionganensis]|uniref:Probable membrane transporter protein n=1 Tax=Actinokineospora xionganensis TaxID=2684470 RepID=A0ABR7LFI9_9PSEU|nr:TSUP family transporter [Actinokineospora xionganensis]MBC6451253.1 sulfite exporter TauE/SafE family protein [Actinokineospora xionganensis]
MNTVLLALTAGAVIGIALGALGGGGGVLGVPVLIYLLGLDPASAATASLLVVSVTSVTALVRHAHNVRWRTGAVFAAAGLLPAIGAATLAEQLPRSVLTGTFAMVAAAAAFALVRKVADDETPALLGGVSLKATKETHSRTNPESAPRSTESHTADMVGGNPIMGPLGGADNTSGADSRPGGGSPITTTTTTIGQRPRAGIGRAMASGGGLGAITGLLGVGGGFLAVPTLVTVMRLRMRAAVATSLFVIAVNSAAALATRLGTTAPDLNWAVLGPFAGAALLGAWDGKRLSAKVSETTLRRLFAVLLFGVAAFMLVDSVIRHVAR